MHVINRNGKIVKGAYAFKEMWLTSDLLPLARPAITHSTHYTHLKYYS